MKRICVFCGSSPGARAIYNETAREVGALLARREIGLVYGGAQVGVMGAVANGVLQAGGEVIGIIPRSLVRKEVAHPGLEDLRIVGSMHERKAQMADLADGFLALPGGCGTFEELFEILTWAQIGIHCKPIGLLNVADYYAPLLALLDHAVAERFIRPEHRGLLLADTDPERLLDAMERYEPLFAEKWMDRDET
ncbi:MAG TPA: TIGR00730 family Rossman fold protein [Chthonomonadaceae bacterium]|nr:TIGR00730 family Rossman fold protein [Chthonomonadaceae bacterium]